MWEIIPIGLGMLAKMLNGQPAPGEGLEDPRNRPQAFKGAGLLFEGYANITDVGGGPAGARFAGLEVIVAVILVGLGLLIEQPGERVPIEDGYHTTRF